MNLTALNIEKLLKEQAEVQAKTASTNQENSECSKTENNASCFF